MRFLFDLAGVLVLLACSGALGLRLLGRYAGAFAPGERLLFAVGMGTWAMGLAQLALGSAGLLGPWTVAALWAAALAAGWTPARRLAGELRAAGLPRPPAEPFLLLAAACALAGLLFNYAPPLRDDSNYAYLAVARLYVRQGSTWPIEGIAHSYTPQGVEMLYAQLCAVVSPLSAKLLHWAFALLSGAALAALARSVSPGLPPGLPLAMFLSMPWVTNLVGTGKTDLGAVFYCLLFLRLLQAWAASEQSASLLLAGLFAAAAFSAKATLASAVAAAALALVWLGRRKGWGPALSQASLFLALTGAGAAPWLLRAWIAAGNPLYPEPLLGLPYDPYPALNYGAASGAFLSLGAALQHLFNGFVYQELIEGTGPLVWALAPWALARMGGAAPALGLTGGLQMLLTVIHWPTVILPRYLAPGISVLIVLGAPAALELTGGRRGRWLAAVFWLSLAVPGAALSAWFGIKRLPLFLGLQSETEFLERNWRADEPYAMHRFIRERVPGGSGILVTYHYLAASYHYPEHRLVGLGLFPPEFYARTPDAEALRALRAKGIDYVLLSPGLLFKVQPDGSLDCGPLGFRIGWFRKPNLGRLLVPVFASGDSTLYRIRA